MQYSQQYLSPYGDSFNKSTQYFNINKLKDSSKTENDQLRSQNEKLKQLVTKLRKQLQQKVQTLQKFNDLMKIKYLQIKTLKSTTQTMSAKITQLQKSSPSNEQRLKQLFLQKSLQFEELNDKINNLQNENFKIEIYQMKIGKLYDQLEEQKGKNNTLVIEQSEMRQKVKQLEERCSGLEYDARREKTLSKIVNETAQVQQLFTDTSHPISSSKSIPSKRPASHLSAFEDALKVQLKQIQQLKQVIQQSKQITQTLRDNLISSRQQLAQLRSEMRIMQVKSTAERKKIIMQYRLQLHQKDNEINSAFKKYKTLEEKYKHAVQDIKAKDQFLRQHLVGRLVDVTAQEYVEGVLRKYTEGFEELVDVKTENQRLQKEVGRYRRYEREIGLAQ